MVDAPPIRSECEDIPFGDKPTDTAAFLIATLKAVLFGKHVPAFHENKGSKPEGFAMQHHSYKSPTISKTTSSDKASLRTKLYVPVPSWSVLEWGTKYVKATILSLGIACIDSVGAVAIELAPAAST